MSFFDFNIKLFTKRNLPTRKRGESHIDLLSVLLFGIKTVFNDFTSFRTATLKEMSYNSQTIILEKALNDIHDNSLRRIFIDNTFDNKVQVRIFQRSEDNPLFVFQRSENKPVTLFNRSEFDVDFDFVVFVAVALSDIQDQIASTTSFYKISSTRFKIELY